MTIQWYPGHMTKTFRLIEQDLKIVDVIIYVLDSRAPYSCAILKTGMDKKELFV